MSTALAVPRSADEDSKRPSEVQRGRKIYFNRAVLRLSPQEAQEWPQQTLRADEEDESSEETQKISNQALEANC